MLCVKILTTYKIYCYNKRPVQLFMLHTVSADPTFAIILLKFALKMIYVFLFFNLLSVF